MKYSSVMRMVLNDIFVLPLYSGLVWGPFVCCVNDILNSFPSSERGNELAEQSSPVYSFRAIGISPVQEYIFVFKYNYFSEL